MPGVIVPGVRVIELAKVAMPMVVFWPAATLILVGDLQPGIKDDLGHRPSCNGARRQRESKRSRDMCCELGGLPLGEAASERWQSG